MGFTSVRQSSLSCIGWNVWAKGSRDLESIRKVSSVIHEYSYAFRKLPRFRKSKMAKFRNKYVYWNINENNIPLSLGAVGACLCLNKCLSLFYSIQANLHRGRTGMYINKLNGAFTVGNLSISWKYSKQGFYLRHNSASQSLGIRTPSNLHKNSINIYTDIYK